MRSARCGFIIYITVILGLAACTTGQVKTAKTLNLSKRERIELRLEFANHRLQTETLAQQVGKNLQGWGYPIGPASGQAYSHIMKAVIETVSHSSTPTGFSFSVGNSDPRAMDFQKADVLPITCQLSTVNQPDETAGLSMDFSDSAVTTSTPNLDELAGHISTVCFNLMRELNWPINTGENSSEPGKTNGWTPEIRIETQEAEPIKTLQTENTNKPRSNIDLQADKPKQVTKVISKGGRKIYIIHNQGNPITFQFGNERK
jgi:hypothetical protein